MDPRLLRFFVTVYEEKNISRAAQRCFVSQPSITNGIKQLEDIVGKTLFLRHKRGTDPTPEADMLYPKALGLLADLDKIGNLFQGKRERLPLTIGIMPDMPDREKADFYKKIYEAIPDVDLNLVGMEDKSDMRLLIREYKHEDEIFISVWEEDYVLCVPDNHPLATKPEVDIRDLDGYSFIECPPCEAHQQTMAVLSASGKGFDIVARAKMKSEVLALVLSGVGISFLPEYFARDKEGIVLRRVNGPGMSRNIGIAYKCENLNKPALRMVVEFFGKK
ncbi:LysR family transcriptional regulator (plasmid) [Fulvitalea axinellae]|uniref:LysR family transcriptional regulator n=1 Tax=Fulvitalea axinellae TaxID=1182444 RepID=A0AAU9D618_9BACT|nr:LysR family transcriptional regulator [Fulvitalea axinellae]